MQTTVQSSPKSIQIKVGKNHRVETWMCNGKFRTEAQLLAVEAISKRDDFDFTCWDKLFEPEMDTNNYQGPFVFVWYSARTMSYTELGSPRTAVFCSK